MPPTKQPCVACQDLPPCFSPLSLSPLPSPAFPLSAPSLSAPSLVPHSIISAIPGRGTADGPARLRQPGFPRPALNPVPPSPECRRNPTPSTRRVYPPGDGCRPARISEPVVERLRRVSTVAPRRDISRILTLELLPLSVCVFVSRRHSTLVLPGPKSPYFRLPQRSCLS